MSHGETLNGILFLQGKMCVGALKIDSIPNLAHSFTYNAAQWKESCAMQGNVRWKSAQLVGRSETKTVVCQSHADSHIQNRPSGQTNQCEWHLHLHY